MHTYNITFHHQKNHESHPAIIKYRPISNTKWWFANWKSITIAIYIHEWHYIGSLWVPILQWDMLSRVVEFHTLAWSIGRCEWCRIIYMMMLMVLLQIIILIFNITWLHMHQQLILYRISQFSPQFIHQSDIKTLNAFKYTLILSIGRHALAHN